MALNDSDLPKLVELLNLIDIRFKVRRKTAAAWTSSNEVLLSGEWGKETDTAKMKQGDGVTAWNDLDYFSSGTSLDGDNAGANIVIDTTNPDVPVISSTLGVVTLKGRVATYAGLPGSGNTSGDAYVNDADKLVYVWNGTAWPANGAGIQMGGGWTRVFSSALSNTNNWSGYCGRTVYPAAIFPFGAKKVRLVFKSGTSSCTISAARISLSKNSASGQPIDYDGTPTVVTWGSSNNVVIPANSFVVSDELLINLPAMRALMISMDINASNAATGNSSESQGARTYYVAGSDIANPAVGPYTLSTVTYGLAVSVIETE